MPSGTNAPLVAIHNNLETFFRFLKRADDPNLFQKRKYRGDRGLFWLGDPKLVFVTAPVPDGANICNRLGYPGTIVVAPENPTHQLSLNIINEAALLERILEFAGPGRTVQLVPYATTPELYQLADVLRTRFNLTVLLPESPAPENLWVRDYADTKAGFRILAGQWLGDGGLFPTGFACRDKAQAIDSACWFYKQGRACVVKADGGESGIGHLIFEPAQTDPASIQKAITEDPFLRDDLIIVEEYIHSTAMWSPSFEFFVPPAGSGKPRLTYVSQQLFSSFGRFAGVMVSQSLLQADWYESLNEQGLKIARNLQAMGYVGHFDVDAVVDDSGHAYLLEMNARRTGGTYVHEFGVHTFGQDYLRRVVLLSKNVVSCPGITTTQALLDRLSDLLYPTAQPDHGVVVTVTSTLGSAEFGCILIAPNEADVLRLDEALQQRLSL